MPPGPKHINLVRLPQWRYISGTSVTADGTSQAVPVPSTASIVEIRAREGGIYFTLNHVGFASATAPGYVPADGAEIIGPLSNLDNLDVYGEAGDVAHIMFFEEVAR